MRIALLLLLCVAPLLLNGCQKSLPATVSGAITMDGQPIASDETVRGEVMFYPVGGGAAAYGAVSRGKYEIKTGDAQGLAPGEYIVTVRVVEIPPPPPGGYPNAPTGKQISPPRYMNKSQSDLKASVAEGSNSIDLDLKSS